MGTRDISDRVLAELEQGKSREDIFMHLSSTAPTDAGKIAYCIASIPENNLRRKHLNSNALLCVLLVAYSVLTALTGLPLEPGEPTIFLVLTTIVPLIFCYFVFRFHGGVYRLAGIWFLIDLLETVLFVGAPNGLSVIKLLTLFFIVILSFLIARKVFPNLGILGPKRDNSGKYIL